MKSRHEPVSLPEGQSASRPERLASAEAQDPPLPLLVFLWCAPSFSSLFCRFSVLVSRELSGSRGAQQPLRPSEGLAGVVVPHLFVAVRFPPTREGSGTKC